MKTFIVEVARDATVRYRAEVKAENLEEVKSHMRNHGYIGPIQGEWEQTSVNTFDNVEEFVVEDSSGTVIYQEERR